MHSKEELSNRIAQSRATFAAQFQRLSDEQLLRIPGPQPGKSVKDLLAHIVWWEEFMAFRMALVLAGESIQRVERLDAINEQVYLSCKATPLETVLSQFASAKFRVQEAIAPLSWEQINGGVDYLGGSLLSVIASNTYEHYDEHLAGLERYATSATSVIGRN